MEYSIVITTSGIGSRLGGRTREMNKSLVDVGGRPVLSWILDSYPKEVPLVITVGYRAEQVYTFLQRTYPDRNIIVVPVDPFDGLGSSLGYSLLQAEPHAQRPFIFHACDSLVFDEVPTPSCNWAMGASVLQDDGRRIDASQYRTQQIKNGYLCAMRDKGERPFSAIHIGIVGVHDVVDFWQHLHALYREHPFDQGISDTHVIQAMMHDGITFAHVRASQWFDTGNPEALRIAEQAMACHPYATRGGAA